MNLTYFGVKDMGITLHCGDAEVVIQRLNPVLNLELMNVEIQDQVRELPHRRMVTQLMFRILIVHHIYHNFC